MKWFLAALVAANVLIALLGALSKPVVTDITTRESNANQIKLVPTGEISPLAALTAPKAGSALPPTPDAPAPVAAPPTPPVTSLAAALAPEAAHSASPASTPSTPSAPAAALAPTPGKADAKPLPAAKPAASAPKAEPTKPEPAKPEPSKAETKPAAKPAEVKKPEPKPEPKPEAKPEAKAPAKAEAKPVADNKVAKLEPKPEAAKPEKTDAAKAKPKLMCYQSAELDSATATKLKAALNKAGLASKMQESVHETGRTGGKFWVYLPAQSNRDEVLKQSASLKDKGFDNYVVNTDGEHKNALSMGLFSQEDSAKAMLKRLNDSGYPAKLAPRGGTPVSSSTVRVDGLDEAASASLNKATAGLTGLKPTSCKP